MLSDLIYDRYHKKLQAKFKDTVSADEYSDFLSSWRKTYPKSYKAYRFIEHIEFRVSKWFTRIHDLKYDFKCRFKRRYYMIDTGLPKWNYHEVDTRMLYGMMKLLKEYVEYQKPFERIDWDSDPGHQQAKKDMLEILEWWDKYEKRKEQLDKAFDLTEDTDNPDDKHDRMFAFKNENLEKNKELFDFINKEESTIEQEETEMLIKLIKIRGYLWT